MELTRHSVGYWIENGYFSASRKTISGHVDVHWHDFYEIELILRGGVYSIDGISYPIRAGSLFIMSSGSFHTIEFDEGTELINLMFTSVFADADLASAVFSKKPHTTLLLDDAESAVLQCLLSETVLYSDTGIEVELRYVSGIIDSILGKISLMKNEDSDSSDSLPISRAILYINGNFTKGITLADAAATAGYTPNYFGNKFKLSTGKTFKQYVTDMRFSYAEYLLLNTALSVGEICESCGFGDLSNFLCAFKKRFGVTPRQFRGK